jgi:hypothetical protein
MLADIYKSLKKIFNKMQKTTYFIKSDKINKNHKYLFDNSPFISSYYTNIITSFFNITENIKYIDKESNNIISLFLITTNNKKYDVWSNSDYSILNLNIIMVLSVLKYLNITDKTIPIYFFPTPFKKLWNNNNLTPEVINSGFSIPDTLIVIYRKEEYNRLLFHEIIHFLQLDKSNTPYIWTATHLKISADYNIFKHINLYETFTDTWAILLMIITLSIIEPKYTIHNLLNKERKYSECMVKQLLHQMMTPDTNSIRDFKWIQSTSALSYYIFKYAALNIIDFDKKYKLNTEWNENKIDEFYNDIKRYLIKHPINKEECDKSSKLSYIGYDI